MIRQTGGHDVFGRAGAGGVRAAGLGRGVLHVHRAANRESFDAADHERLAVSAYLIGKDDDSAKAWEAAQRAAAATGDVAEAARYAFWLAFILMLQGQMAHAAGWLMRSDRLIQKLGEDCPASGYVLVPRFLGALEEGIRRPPATSRPAPPRSGIASAMPTSARSAPWVTGSH